MGQFHNGYYVCTVVIICCVIVLYFDPCPIQIESLNKARDNGLPSATILLGLRSLPSTEP